MTHFGNTLYLDTSGSVLMLAIGKAGESGFAFEHQAHSKSHRYHSAMLIPLIQEGLTQAGLSIQDLNHLAIHIGPGSFTGIRTGIVTARTIAQFVPLTVHTFTAFDVIAGALNSQQAPVAIYIDALRNRAYHATVRQTTSGFESLITPRLISLPEDLSLPIEQVICSESLESTITCTQTIESLHIFSPQVMAALLQQHPAAFQKPWKEVLPLYLQEPNITLRKAQAGTLK